MSAADLPKPSLPALGEHDSAAVHPYEVVARRYRPQLFSELVGQGHISQALTNAIATHRVGHAYLFTGARGTGKTSTARIFAKALCCEKGPTDQPCNQCDLCENVSRGSDIDVLEFDGASNRGIDEIRQLRANVNIRPSRARFKIYIIDEVHMLTKEAFNALLKTLEEPPSHVKFIFCTTDPERVPITVLSRCQRFDFAPVEQREIVTRLESIVQSESRTADREALEAIARKAAGSMRDSQSLLEQLLSFGAERLTLVDVHRMLGTANAGRLGAVVDHLSSRNPPQALADIDAALAEGVEAGQLTEQLLGYFRDLMAVAVDCPASALRSVSESDHGKIVAQARALGLETILAMMQIVDQTLIRMKHSMHPRTLLEMAVVRICHLENLDELSQLVAQVSSGTALVPGATMASNATTTTAAGPAGQKKNEPLSVAPTRPVAATVGSANGVSISSEGRAAAEGPEPSSRPESTATMRRVDPPAATTAVEGSPAPSQAITPENLRQVWQRAVAGLEGMLADYVGFASGVVISGPRRVTVSYPAHRANSKTMCERPVHKQQLEQALSQVAGEPWSVQFEVVRGEAPPVPVAPPPSPRQLTQKAITHPFVKQAIAVFGGEILKTEEPRTPAVVVKELESDKTE